MSQNTNAPEERSTSFEAVGGAQAEHYNGATLMVCAYVAVIFLLLVWVALIWRKAGAMTQRLTALEREIDKAADKAERADKAKGD
jgi:hypothetical protein